MVPTVVQKDIVSWLDRAEQPELEANGIYLIPSAADARSGGGRALPRLQLFESQLEQRKFLVAHASGDAACPSVPAVPCHYELELEAVGHEYGLPPKLVVQIVQRPNPSGDEDAIFEDRQTNRRWSVRHQHIQFPLLSAGPSLRLIYRRARGAPALVVLVLFLNAQEYLDRFVHIYDSAIRANQYGVSAVHYSNLTTVDGTALINRCGAALITFEKTEKYSVLFRN